MLIGVFDSGLGGTLVTEQLRLLLPQHRYRVVNDREHVPYGSKTNDEVIRLTDAAIQPLVQGGCQIIILACNTATMAAITTLRGRYPRTRFIGVEPMIKPAAERSTTKHITVLATPLTLASQRYHHLKSAYGQTIQIDEPDTSGWAAAIEQGSLEQIDLSGLQESIAAGSDSIVVACTHYLALIPLFEQQLRRHCVILEPTSAIARQVERLAMEQVR